MLPTFILRKRVQALRPNAHLIRSAQVIGWDSGPCYAVLDFDRDIGCHTSIARGYTARTAWRNALAALRA